MTEVDGVTKFVQDFTRCPPLDFKVLAELDSWRRVFYINGLIGQDPSRYGGNGYGNVSQRYVIRGTPSSFIVSGSQTGHIPVLDSSHYTTVVSCNPDKNFVVCRGPVKASSESMTHSTIYEFDDSANFVFHSHSPKIWRFRHELEIPCTADDVAYGTPQMAEEVRRLYRDGNFSGNNPPIFAMGGHEDGIITFGKNSIVPGIVMLEYLLKGIDLSNK